MGDVFRRNDDGSLDFVDRAKYMIKTGGENVYPAEIERVLLSDPRITEATVVRAPDARWGEVPVAFVSRRDTTITEPDLLNLCRRDLAGYKCPRQFRFIEFSRIFRARPAARCSATNSKPGSNAPEGGFRYIRNAPYIRNTPNLVFFAGVRPARSSSSAITSRVSTGSITMSHHRLRAKL